MYLKRTILVMLLSLSTPCFGVLLVNDTFSDNERDTDSGGTPQTSLDWNVKRNTAMPHAVTANGALVIPNSSLLTTSFNSFTLSESLTSVTVSFNFSVATITSLQTWRWGIVNSAGHPTGDQTGAANGDASFDLAKGYAFIGGIGPAVATNSWRLGETDLVSSGQTGVGLSNGAASPQLGSFYSTTAMTANTTYTASLTLSYNPNGSVNVSAIVDGVNLASVNDLTPSSLTFNNFWMFNTLNGAVTIDNFQIDATVVPEPSTTPFLAAGLLALPWLRRKRRLA
jgi:hypothetical protein